MYRLCVWSVPIVVSTLLQQFVIFVVLLYEDERIYHLRFGAMDVLTVSFFKISTLSLSLEDRLQARVFGLYRLCVWSVPSVVSTLQHSSL